MFNISFFEIPGSILAWLYGWTNSYAAAIAIIAVIVMAIVTPLLLRSTRGMLEMQRLAPEMKRLQAEFKHDKTQLNQEMMKLYQEHKVNPAASCLPLAAQMPIFFMMFRILTGLTWTPTGGQAVLAHTVLTAAGENPDSEVGFFPRYIGQDTELYKSLVHQTEMKSLGLDLSRSASEMLTESFARGVLYVAIVALLAGLYFVQQRMVAARATVNPSMSATQQKLMQYLPVAFAVFQIFFLLGLVLYYICQTLIRIAQQAYITRIYYGGEESLGRQAQAASEKAKAIAKQSGEPSGLFDRLKAQAEVGNDNSARNPNKPKPKSGRPDGGTNRTTPPKNRTADKPKGSSKGRPQSNKKRRRN